ncbi:MAG: hypothetical protein ACH350_00520 [Parachlamydiaceae bacterium]
MEIMDSIPSFVNYGMTSIDHGIKKITGNPSHIKKVLQIVGKTWDLFDEIYGRDPQKGEVRHVFKGSIEIIGFYGTYKNLMYWVNLFSKESMDGEALKESIVSSLCASHKNQQDKQEQEKLAESIFSAVMKEKTYHSKKEVLNVIEAELVKNGYDAEQAKQIANRISVKQKARPPIELMYMACFTTVELASNILTLQKWHVVDLAKLAATIGSQSKIFLFVIDLGTGVVLGGIASAGLALTVAESSYQTIILGTRYFSLEKGDAKNVAYQELTDELFNLGGSTLDLVATAAPLFFALNPTTIIALAIVSKGVGIIRVLIK